MSNYLINDYDSVLRCWTEKTGWDVRYEEMWEGLIITGCEEEVNDDMKTQPGGQRMSAPSPSLSRKYKNQHNNRQPSGISLKTPGCQPAAT